MSQYGIHHIQIIPEHDGQSGAPHLSCAMEAGGCELTHEGCVGYAQAAANAVERLVGHHFGGLLQAHHHIAPERCLYGPALLRGGALGGLAGGPDVVGGPLGRWGRLLNDLHACKTGCDVLGGRVVLVINCDASTTR